MQFSLNLLKYEDIKQQIIDYLNTYSTYAVNNGGQFDFSSSNLSHIINPMAYTAMMEAFNTSFVANNVFLETIEDRKLAVSKAKELGYTPKRPFAAIISGTLVYKSNNLSEQDTFLIPAREIFLSNNNNVFTNLDSIVFKYKGNSNQLEADFLLIQGTFKYYSINVPTINDSNISNDNFSFVIPSAHADKDNLSIYVIPSIVVNDPVNDLFNHPEKVNEFLEYKWNLIDNFNSNFEGNGYYLEEDTDNEGFPKIVFSNSSFNTNSVPQQDHVIICEYFETKGSKANNDYISILPNILDSKYVSSNIESGSLSKIKAFGGGDLETLDSIIINAPRYRSTGGNIISENDYLYALSTYSELGAYSVIGGDELYPTDNTKAGNIYICAIPNCDPSTIIDNNGSYLTNMLKQSILTKLDKKAIKGTKRHFFAPTYIVIEIEPLIELNNNLTPIEKSQIKLQVQKLLLDFFNTNFNNFGVPFRESKVFANIDSLDYVISSSYNMKTGFLINNWTVTNLIENIDQYLTLPILNIKDNNGKVIGTKKYVKSNYDVIIRDLYDFMKFPDSYNNFTEQQKAIFDELIKYLPIDKRSIYSTNGLSCPTHNRYIYNQDISENSTELKIWSKNDIINVSKINGILQGETIHNKIIDWKIISTSDSSYYKVKKGNDIVGLLEYSHNTISSSNNSFKGFVTKDGINSDFSFSEIITEANINSLNIGDYYIIKELIWNDSTIYEPESILYCNDDIINNVKRLFKANSKINSVDVVEGGQNYINEVVDIHSTNGSNATGLLIVSNGKIESIWFDEPNLSRGEGFQINDILTFTNSIGTGAILKVNSLVAANTTSTSNISNLITNKNIGDVYLTADGVPIVYSADSMLFLLNDTSEFVDASENLPSLQYENNIIKIYNDSGEGIVPTFPVTETEKINILSKKVNGEWIDITSSLLGNTITSQYIESITGDGSLVTVVLTETFHLKSGSHIKVRNCDIEEYNIDDISIQVNDATSFSYSSTATGTPNNMPNIDIYINDCKIFNGDIMIYDSTLSSSIFNNKIGGWRLLENDSSLTNEIGDITVVDSGSGYINGDIADISSITGTNATAILEVDTSIYDTVILNGGLGYTNNQFRTISQSQNIQQNGQGNTNAIVTVESDSSIKSISIINGQTSVADGTQVRITSERLGKMLVGNIIAPRGITGGYGALGTLVVEDSTIVDIVFENRGTNFIPDDVLILETVNNNTLIPCDIRVGNTGNISNISFDNYSDGQIHNFILLDFAVGAWDNTDTGVYFEVSSANGTGAIGKGIFSKHNISSLPRLLSIDFDFGTENGITASRGTGFEPGDVLEIRRYGSTSSSSAIGVLYQNNIRGEGFSFNDKLIFNSLIYANNITTPLNATLDATIIVSNTGHLNGMTFINNGENFNLNGNEDTLILYPRSGRTSGVPVDFNNLSIIHGGSGYVSGEEVLISSANGGSGAKGKLLVNNIGAITGFDFSYSGSSIGSGFAVGDTLSFNTTQGSGAEISILHANFTNAIVTVSEVTRRINQGAIPISTLSVIYAVSKSKYDIYKISNDIYVSPSYNMLVNPPIDNILTAGTYIIASQNSLPNNYGKWIVFDNDYYTNTIDISNGTSAFPFSFNIGDVFHVTVADANSNTFNGELLNTTEFSGSNSTFVNGNYIYVTNIENNIPYFKALRNDWQTYNWPLYNYIAATVGDTLYISDSGNFNNVNIIKSPKYTDYRGTNFMFDYNTILYFNGSYWMKKYPYHVYSYNSASEQLLNDGGFSCDIKIDQKSKDHFIIYITDIYHNVKIATLNYDSGELTFLDSVDNVLSDVNIISGLDTLTSIFKADNYNVNQEQFDTVYFSTLNNVKDFDSHFNQFILSKIKEIGVK